VGVPAGGRSKYRDPLMTSGSAQAPHRPLYRVPTRAARRYENGDIQEAACWAHVRRKFYDLEQAHAYPVAREAPQRIGTLYAVESEIRGRPPDERRQMRNTRAWPLRESLRRCFEASLTTLSRKSDTTAAIRYALSRWDALLRYSDDGRIEIDNNAAQRRRFSMCACSESQA
jgi:transposase